MGVVFFAGFILGLLIIGGIIFGIRAQIEEQVRKFVTPIIMLFISLPVSWIVFIIFANIFANVPITKNLGFGIYYITTNILGILGYILHKICLHLLKKTYDKSIKKFIIFLFYLNILCDTFPILLYLFDE